MLAPAPIRVKAPISAVGSTVAAGVDQGRGMDAGARGGRGVEHRGDPGPPLVGRRCQDGDGRGRYPVLHVGMHDDGAGLRRVERGGVAAVVEEADLVGPGRLQRCDPGEHAAGIDSRRAAGGFGDLGERERAGTAVEPAIADGSGIHVTDP